MFGSDVLDVAIGITLLFLFVSLICSAMREALETFLKSRAMDLERGIRELLHDQTGTQIADRVFNHPFVFSLFSGQYDPTKLKQSRLIPGDPKQSVMPRKDRVNLPTYIPARNFAAALIDIIRQADNPDAPLSVASLRAGAQTLPEGLRRAVIAALDGAQGDVTLARKNIEAMYDATMDRVSGWYKRRTQVILLAIGFGAALFLNIDAINVARHLATDKSYRAAVVAMAGAVNDGRQPATVQTAGPAPGAASAGQPPDATAPKADAGIKATLDTVSHIREDLDAGGFILGWPAPQLADARLRKASVVWASLQMLFGWIVTALAVSLGAPFWFDLLDKFMVIRSTVKPAEKSGQEASKDAAGPPPAPGNPVPIMLVAAAQPQGGGVADVGGG